MAPRAPGSNRMNVAAGAAHDGSVVVLASGWGGAGFRERILPSLVCRSSDGGRTWEQNSGVTLPDGVQNLIPFGRQEIRRYLGQAEAVRPLRTRR